MLRRLRSPVTSTVLLSSTRSTRNNKPIAPALPPLPKAYDWEAFRQDGKHLIDYIADYHQLLAAQRPSMDDKNAPSVAVQPDVQPGFLAKNRAFEKKLTASVPSSPSSNKRLQPPTTGSAHHLPNFDAVLKEFDAFIRPGMTHWQHPKFLAYFPAQLSPPALLGEMLANAFNQPGFSWDASPSATELEIAVMNAFSRAMNLPERFMWRLQDGGAPAATGMTPRDGYQVSGGGGVLQPSATEATILVMLAAKRRAQRRHSNAFASAKETQDEVTPRLVCYFSDQSHFMQVKAAKVLGISHVRTIKTYHNQAVDNFPMCPITLRERIAEDIGKGLIPFYINGNFGATGTCAVDPLEELGRLAKECRAWLHVDAAYAGAVALCPEHRHLLGTLDGVDSLSINGSKWMSMMFNCSLLFFSESTDIVPSLNATGSYLPPASASKVDLKDYQLGLGRPFRALKCYSTIRMIGFDGMANIVRRHIILAKYLEEKLRNIPALEILVKTDFALVVIRIKMASDEENKKFCDRLQTHANLYALPATVGNKVGVRLSLAYAALDYADADAIYNYVVECLSGAH